MLKPGHTKPSRAQIQAGVLLELYTAIGDRADEDTGATPIPCAAPARRLPPSEVGPPTLGAIGAWVSDTPHVLEGAALACGPCPVLELCREAGRREVAGVWGGKLRDREMYREPKPDGGPTLAPSKQIEPLVLLALATQDGYATAAEVAETVDVENVSVVSQSLQQLVRSGDALRVVAPHTSQRSYAATQAGTQRAERALAGVGGSASAGPAG